jgi:CDP-diacylglycerol--serine O-phosphatidyltransferase
VSEDNQQQSPDPVSKLESSLPVGEHIEEVSEGGQRVRRRGVYLLPNIFTMGALFAGFYAVVAAMNGHFENAAIAVFVAQFLDGMDGRVARITNTQSAFGAQLDSLADMVSFGVAPALVVFSWGLGPLGRLGWALAFIYVAGAALRLARFNTQIETADNRFFSGLASPPAAALIASMVWLGVDSGMQGDTLPYSLSVAAGIITALVGVLMVTNIPYHSFKGVDFKGRVPFVMALLIPLLIAIIFIDPPLVLLAIAGTYAISGPLQQAWSKLRAKGS